jgi:hypothetical protein
MNPTIIGNATRYLGDLDEDALEAAYWAFDTERKRTGMERDAFKGQMRQFARNTLKRNAPNMGLFEKAA